MAKSKTSPNKSLVALIILCIVSALSGCDMYNELTKDPVRIETYTKTEWYGEVPMESQFLKIQAVEEHVTIKSVKVNHGNCKVYGNRVTELKYGNEVSVSICSDEVREVDISTDLGDFTYEF